MQTENSIMEPINQARGNIIHIMSNISGRGEPQSEIFLLMILGYIVFLLLLLYIHRKLLKKQKKTHENLVLAYDTIRYQLAKTQYEKSIAQENIGINSVLETDHKTYLAHAKTIKQEILDIEEKNGQQIVSTNQRNMIHRQTKKKNRLTIGVEIVGRITTILTIGIYKLFR